MAAPVTPENFDEAMEGDAIERIEASRSMLKFTLYTKPDYLVGWFHRELMDALDEFLTAVIAKESPRLMLCAPPRHGKSEASSRRFPAFALGNYPWLEILLWSYAATLAEDMNEDVQKIIDSPEYGAVFPGIYIARPGRAGEGAKRNRQETHIIGHAGKLRAAGVGGGVTGKGAHILAIDDPFQDDQDSGSATQREKVWNRYVSTAYTRLAPGGGILLTQTCWHEDDLAGRLQAATEAAIKGDDPYADRFKIIKFPAIADHDEPHRKEGEALHPERYPLPALLKIKTTLGSYFWSALYQQRPAPAEGDVFKTFWWKYWRELPPMTMLKLYADTAMKSKEIHDWSVFQVWGLSVDHQIYLLDQIRGKWESPELEKEARSFWAKWQGQPMGDKLPHPYELAVEDKASGTGLIQSLKRGRGAIPVTAIKRDIDKLVRARSSAPSIEAGNVFLPDPKEQPMAFLSDYKTEFAAFTAAMSHKHDDQIDPTMDAIHDMLLGNADFYGEAL